MVTTRKQREAMWRLFQRSYDGSYEDSGAVLRRYRAFRRKVQWAGTRNDHWLFVQLWGMWIGIERDGYTHS